MGNVICQIQPKTYKKPDYKPFTCQANPPLCCGFQMYRTCSYTCKLASKLLLSRDVWMIWGILLLGIPVLATCLILMGMFVHIPNAIAIAAQDAWLRALGGEGGGGGCRRGISSSMDSEEEEEEDK